FLTKENIAEYIEKDYDLAINTIDFTSDIPFLFDDICCSMKIQVLHPLNLGWGASVIVINQKSRKLRELHQSFDGFELHMAQHILKELENKKLAPADYLKEIIKRYSKVKNDIESPPQLSVGSFLVASMCARLMYNFCVGKDVNTFPEVYFRTIE
ncbi:MAG: ThiF family adenylyltransferase, partial [Bacteroidota bacterium]